MSISARATRKVAVLLVEENAPCARLHQAYLSTLKHYQFDVTHAKAGLETLKLIQQQNFDLVLLNLQLPDLGGMDLFEALSSHLKNTACIILSETGSMSEAVDVMRLGARDFLVKPTTQAKLTKAVNSVLIGDQGQIPDQEATLQIKSTTLPEDGFEAFIGGSDVMKNVYETIQKSAPSKAPVFITGESGTGKELCAEAIHSISSRAGKPFIALNCSAIPAELIESEIFGHVKGAFTGAYASHIGAAEQADGGVLFLDEICEMDLALQAKLLRFIQTGDIKPVGAKGTKKVDVRFICATNKNPQECVEKGTFREDLYYRLHVLPISLPPLRERGQDAVQIAVKMLDLFMEEEGKVFDGFNAQALRIIEDYDWPGNVRQLLNVMRHIVVMNEGGAVTPDMLGAIRSNCPYKSPLQKKDGNNHPQTLFSPQPESLTIRPLWQEERDIIENAITLCGGNIVEAANHLKISPSTIYRKRQSWVPLMQDHSYPENRLAH